MAGSKIIFELLIYLKWSFFNHEVKHLLSVIDVFTKYAWVKALTDWKSETVPHGFIEIVNKSKCKPNKLWFNQGRDLYNDLMQKWFDNNILICNDL